MTQYIVIQGPTTYYKELIDAYKSIPNIIISTFNNMPVESINELSTHFPVIVSDSNINPGKGNLNYQCMSSYNGLDYVKNLGTTHALKLRSDLIISDPQKFMNILEKYNKLTFLAWHGEGYLVDYLNYGPINDMLNFWNLQICNDKFGELNLLEHYCQSANISPITYENIKTKISFFMEDLIHSEIRIYWLKYQIYISDYYKYECYIYK